MMINLIPGSGSTTHKLIKNTEVTFNLTCNTKFGERVALIGNLSLLGHWDTNKIVYLDTNDQIYPIWTIKIDLPRDKIVEYKYLVITEPITGPKNVKPKITWENLPPNVNRIVNTHGKKEVVLYESLQSLESIEEYVEVNQVKHFMSSSDQDSFKQEDFDSVHATGNQKKFKQEKRKIMIDQEEDEEGYRDSDSADADDERSHVTTEQAERNRYLQNAKEQLNSRIPQVFSQRCLDKKTLNEQSMGSLSSVVNQADIKIDPLEPRIIATFNLPYQIQRDVNDRTKFTLIETYQHPIFLFASLKKLSDDKKYTFLWVGLFTTNEELTNEEKISITEQLKQKSCFPIFVSLHELTPCMKFYQNALKTIFHNFKALYQDYSLVENMDQWKEYQRINQLFANKIFEVKNMFSKQNLKQVWIHGDQLLMVAFYLKKKFLDANIGFFFHTPFPSSGIFRMFQFRTEILNSLLHCDLVGFHLFEHARNFLMTCHRMLGLEYEFLRGGYLAINNHGKHVMIRVSHIGIDPDFFEEILKSKNYRKQLKLFKTQFEQIKTLYKDSQPIIISSINSCHPISGVQNKLVAYAEFLRKYPNYKNKICLIQYSTPNISTYENKKDKTGDKFQGDIEILAGYREKTLEQVKAIQKEFGPQTLFYYEENPTLEKRLALWTVSNILLVSNLKDGLCLPPLEYTITKKFTNKFENALMLISEFSGANRAFTGFLEFNPFNIQEFQLKLDQGLSMTPLEKGDLMRQAYGYVQRTSTSKWVESFLRDLKYAYKPSSMSYYLGDQNINMAYNMRVIHSKSQLKKLDLFECDSNFQNSKRCVIFIDHEALPTLDYAQDTMMPIRSTLEDLEEIAVDSRNTVIIFSNQSKNTMKELFEQTVNNIWLVAESGYLYKTGPQAHWKQLTQLAKKVWLNPIQELMQIYTQNVDGSVVEERESTLVWNYKNAEEEQGIIVSKELYGQIKQLLGNAPVEIVQGKGYLEVKPIKLKKQKLVKTLFQQITQNTQKIDYLLYIGTGTGNEVVYNFLKSKRAEQFYNSSESRKFICTLGKKPTCAQFFLDDVEEVKFLLNKLRHSTQKRKKTRSYADLKTALGLDKETGSTGKITRVDRSSNNLFQLFHHQMVEEDDEDEEYSDLDDLDQVSPSKKSPNPRHSPNLGNMDIQIEGFDDSSKKTNSIPQISVQNTEVQSQKDKMKPAGLDLSGLMPIKKKGAEWSELIPTSPRKFSNVNNQSNQKRN
eukprot:403366928